MLQKVFQTSSRVATRAFATSQVAQNKQGAAELAHLLEERIAGEASQIDLQKVKKMLKI